MASGVMLTKASECTENDDMVDGLEFDLDLPLIKALNSIFEHLGCVIIDFPGVPDKQVNI